MAGARAYLKFKLEPESIFLGWLRLLFLASEKRNDLKMYIFHCIGTGTVHILVELMVLVDPTYS